MAMFDKSKEVAEKVENATEGKVDKLDELIEKAAHKIDEKTDGKYSDKIESAVGGIQDPAGATARDEEPPKPPPAL